MTMPAAGDQQRRRKVPANAVDAALDGGRDLDELEDAPATAGEVLDQELAIEAEHERAEDAAGAEAELDPAMDADDEAAAAALEEGDPASGGEAGQDRDDSVDADDETDGATFRSSAGDLPTREEWERKSLQTSASPRSFHHDYLARRLYAALEPLDRVIDAVAEAELDPKVIRVLTSRALDDELQVPFLPAGMRGAEVRTPAIITVTAFCPNCDLPVSALVTLNASLTVEPTKSELKVKGKTNAVHHVCYQQVLGMTGDVIEGQQAMTDPIEAEATDAEDFDNEDGQAAALEPQDPVDLAKALQDAGFHFSAEAVRHWSPEDQAAALEYAGTLLALAEGDVVPDPPAILRPAEEAAPAKGRKRKAATA